ncbi:heme exporter protein CcmD [Hydrocarboniclastica marina]|uniref:Heme exporter protein D n=1 Tax=Hydrocarboniclastica marina TaxID=2259620 RepID=A0A4P7XGX7_9ALTE|nr:heme exporter protein CcmD [Hydrocarboniclastica marina]MAL98545.1 heme exporter protein CcmD [Alteromonadaceae bacterium]QCF25704.1 heme exporter protein CcmD [Hydrocarboniclastica marina]|tara:strand:- start:364 stop:573 length:210 start_codon:yes stop_codon:yes gene_type:complete
MQFESFAEFLAMGRHGLFVWSSYAACVVVLAINVLVPVMQRKTLLAQLRRAGRRSANQTAMAVHDQAGD